jgi:hypothetical protein
VSRFAFPPCRVSGRAAAGGLVMHCCDPVIEPWVFSVAGAGERGRRPAAPMRAMAVAPPPVELRVQAFRAVFRAVLSRSSCRGRVFAGERALVPKPAAPQRAMAVAAPWTSMRAGLRCRAARRGGRAVGRPSSRACVRECLEGNGRAEAHPSAESRARTVAPPPMRA